MPKLLSLFDGSGGFPLAGAMCGITPVAASEIEPYPIAVTKGHFPKMKHLGDISKINGAEIEPVDVITFGSPCQDLSVAGKRAGLKHESHGDDETTRSGLFMEAVRIINEMRRATDGKYPKFAMWENVPGAFSSNKGEDFRIVLEELIKIVEPTAAMPPIPKKGWSYSDSYSGDGWSLAYRVLDAQYWGVPQRRRRIYLVLHLTGECAEEVLFERHGLRGYFAEGRNPWQGASEDTERGIGTDDTFIIDNIGGKAEYGKASDVNGTLRAGSQGAVAYPVENHPNDSRVNIREDGKVQSLTSRMGTGGGNVPLVLDAAIPYTMKIRCGREGGGKGALIQTNQSATLATNNDQYVFQPVVCYGISSYESNAMKSENPHSGIYEAETARTLDQNGGNPACHQAGVAVVEQQAFRKTAHPRNAEEGQGWEEATVNDTLNVYDNSETRTPSLIVEKPIAIDRAFFNQGKNALYEPQLYEDGTNPTLVARGPSAVCYGSSPDESTSQIPTYCSSKASFFTRADEELAGTLVTPDYKEPPLINATEGIRYIVRRLTPIECARLQGFPDHWGEITKKKDFSDEEYRFWLDVRNTHAAINGRTVKDYTKKQMLTWYNKLHTDSAEYKMWGNGIALPTALYVMQGISEEL